MDIDFGFNCEPELATVVDNGSNHIRWELSLSFQCDLCSSKPRELFLQGGLLHSCESTLFDDSVVKALFHGRQVCLAV